MKLTFLLALSTLSICSMAQVNSYTFQKETGQPWELSQYPDAEITDHTVMDDVVLPAKIKIPFPFTFNGQLQDSIGISENGFIWFGSAQANQLSTVTAPIGSTLPNTVTGIVSAFGTDLHPVNTDDITTQIRSGIVGTAPMKILIIEWKNTSRLESIRANTAPDTISFQIKLHQFMNRVEVGYMGTQLNFDYTTAAQVGLRGATANDFNARTTEQIGSNWKTTTKATSNSAVCELSPTHFPEYGDLFVWMPSDATGINELGSTVKAIYPNPATDYLTIELAKDEPTTMRLLDITGKTLVQQNIREHYQLDVQKLKPGLYFIQLENPNKSVHTEKIIIN